MRTATAREYDRSYYLENLDREREKRARNKRLQRRRNPDIDRLIRSDGSVNWPKTNQNQLLSYVKKYPFLHVSHFQCQFCGRPAEQRHHYRYGPGCALKCWSVCRRCHATIHRIMKEAGYTVPVVL